MNCTVANRGYAVSTSGTYAKGLLLRPSERAMMKSTNLLVWRVCASSLVMMGLIACGEKPEPSSSNNSANNTSNNSAQVNNSTSANNQTSVANNQTTPANNQTTPANNQTTPANNQTTPPNNTSTGELTYHADIKPMLSQYCTRCHYNGGQGPLDFTTPENVTALSDLIADAIGSGRMPPPVADPSCVDYHNSERMVVTPEAKQMLADWIAGGKVIGEDDGVSAGPPTYATIEEPDLELRLPEPYTPTYQDMDNANNEYRCFALEHGRDANFYITAMHPIVDRPEIVHHVVLAKTSRDKLDPGVAMASGKDCIDDMGALGDFGDGGGIIGAWAPGMDPVVFEDAGLEIKADDVFVLQMHYYSSGGETDGLSDNSGYAMEIADDVRNKILMAPLGKFDFQIPPNEEDYSETAEISLPVPVTLWGVFPHMHVLGKAYAMDFGQEGEEECLLDGDRYDFNNQLTYMFKEPVYITGNTPIRLTCTWNNSVSNPDLVHMPPVPVGYGERTDEEMCYAFSYISLGRKR